MTAFQMARPAATCLLLLGLTTASCRTLGAEPVSRAVASVQSDSTDIVATVERFHATLAAGDSSGAMALLAPDAVILESGGIETREEYQSHHLPGDIAYAQRVHPERGPMRVVVRGDVGWASSSSATTREVRGETVRSNGAELVVLTRTPEGWRINAIHWSSRTVRPSGA